LHSVPAASKVKLSRDRPSLSHLATNPSSVRGLGTHLERQKAASVARTPGEINWRPDRAPDRQAHPHLEARLTKLARQARYQPPRAGARSRGRACSGWLIVQRRQSTPVSTPLTARRPMLPTRLFATLDPPFRVKLDGVAGWLLPHRGFVRRAAHNWLADFPLDRLQEPGALSPAARGYAANPASRRAHRHFPRYSGIGAGGNP